MRGARHKLQVSTFPFLAVLLCAMGSLILFLLVMDRRAKIAARNKAREAVAARSDQQQKLDAEAQARWEQQREQLRQELLAQQAKAQSEATTIQVQLTEAQKKLDAEQSRQQELQQAVVRENTQLTQGEALLASKRANLREAESKQTASKAELAKLGQGVRELEKVLDDLKALKKRANNTYSVVPYRGKHGDRRRPIYVECAGAGLLFHPDRKALPGDFAVQALRDEVERRAGGLTRAKTKPGRDEDPDETPRNPYVLFLIRPDGIDAYYKAQGALRGYQIDFGYEVVDQDWALDFSEANRQWAADTAAPPATTKTPLLPSLPPLPATVSQGPPLSGGAPTPFASGPNLGGGPAMSAPAPSLLGGNNNPVAQSPNVGPVVVNGFPRPVVVEGDGKGKFGGVGSPTFVPITDTPGLSPVATAGPNAPAGGSPGSSDVIASAGGPAIIPRGTPRSPAPSDGVPGLPTPGTGRQGNNQGRPEAAQGTPADGGDGTPGPRPVLLAPPEQPGRKSAPTLGNLIGNRDFVITLHCYDDHVTVFPGGTMYWWKRHPDPEVMNRSIVGNVKQLITSRQASVRPGETPYRPVLRFQVAGDGLRTFLRVYPHLEPLRVHMTREALDE